MTRLSATFPLRLKYELDSELIGHALGMRHGELGAPEFAAFSEPESGDGGN